jgi:hypothetical protein
LKKITTLFHDKNIFGIAIIAIRSAPAIALNRVDKVPKNWYLYLGIEFSNFRHSIMNLILTGFILK